MFRPDGIALAIRASIENSVSSYDPGGYPDPEGRTPGRLNEYFRAECRLPRPNESVLPIHEDLSGEDF